MIQDSINHLNMTDVHRTAQQIIREVSYAIRSRCHRQMTLRYRPRGEPMMTAYERAKKAQTVSRDLLSALSLYAESVKKGDRVDSCIKDFASVLHQLGCTQKAVVFLKEMREYYNGDIRKYDRLKQTLQNQLNPSGKHDCKNLLIELPMNRQVSQSLLQDMFEVTQRIKRARVYNHLSFSDENQGLGKWLLLDFQSFSAAKKTLQKFRYSEWFGVNKFWVRGNEIVCEAQDGREDFEMGLNLSHFEVQRMVSQLCLNNVYNLNHMSNGQKVHSLNLLAIKMIEQRSYKESKTIKKMALE